MPPSSIMVSDSKVKRQEQSICGEPSLGSTDLAFCSGHLSTFFVLTMQAPPVAVTLLSQILPQVAHYVFCSLRGRLRGSMVRMRYLCTYLAQRDDRAHAQQRYSLLRHTGDGGEEKALLLFSLFSFCFRFCFRFCFCFGLNI